MANIRRVALAAATMVLALALPAVASAEIWTHEGSPLAAEAEVEAIGSMAFATGLGVAHGTVEITKKIKPAGKAEVTSYTVTGCKGTGVFAGQHCTVEAKKLPWTIDVTKTGTKTTEVEIAVFFPTIKAATGIAGNIIGTPDDLFAMSSEAFSGEGITINGNPGTVSGEASLSPAGTYGIE